MSAVNESSIFARHRMLHGECSAAPVALLREIEHSKATSEKYKSAHAALIGDGPDCLPDLYFNAFKMQTPLKNKNLPRPPRNARAGRHAHVHPRYHNPDGGSGRAPHGIGLPFAASPFDIKGSMPAGANIALRI